MGQEVQCTAQFGEKVSAGKAKLEPDGVYFRGDFRLSIPMKEVKAVEAKRGQLEVTFAGGIAIFDLGPLAEKWMLKIRYPKGLLDKLGVKPQSRVVVLGVQDAGFWEQLRQRATDISESTTQADADLIFFLAESREDLTRLKTLQDYIKKNGAIWVIAPKGRQHIKEADVIGAGKQAGLVDTKVVSFSETHTGHKLVIPVARR